MKFNFEINLTLGKIIGIIAFIITQYMIISTQIFGLLGIAGEINFTQLVIQQTFVLTVVFGAKASANLVKNLKTNKPGVNDEP